jgi:RES domain
VHHDPCSVQISLKDVAPCLWSGTVWHQSAPMFPALWCPNPARSHGRYHTVGDRGAWYGSLKQEWCWYEFFRHWRRIDLDPFDVVRRVARISVSELPVLDLRDAANRSLVGVDYADLISNDWTICQLLAARVQQSLRFGGILAPSGAKHGGVTLVVYGKATHHLTVQGEHTRRASEPYKAFLDQVVLEDGVSSELIEFYRERQAYWARHRH